MAIELNYDMHSMAHWLLDQGCSIIPLQPQNKIPCNPLLPTVDGKASWAPFQQEHPTKEEVDRWFAYNGRINIGLVTGKISKIGVIDIDDPIAHAYFSEHIAPTASPNYFQTTSKIGDFKKFHAIYRLHQNLKSTAGKLCEHLDTRGEGGYIVSAPSIHPSGAKYKAFHLADGAFDFSQLITFPQFVLDELDRLSTPQVQQHNSVDTSIILNTGAPKSMLQKIPEGQRNVELANYCGRLFGKRLMFDEVLLMAHAVNNQYCSPPLPPDQIDAIVNSIYKTHAKNQPMQINVNGSIEKWIMQKHSAPFTLHNMFEQLTIKGLAEKMWAQEYIEKLLDKGFIEQDMQRVDTYRQINTTVEIIDLMQDYHEKNIDIILPFSLQYNLKIQEKNIIVVAGESNAGKTAFLLNILFNNYQRHRFKYITSEMTPLEINERIQKAYVDKQSLNEKVSFLKCTENYHDIVDPEGINIIDFLEVYDNFYTIGEKIKKIFDRLTTGVAFIAIQKKRGADFGRGGEFTIEKSRLAISLFCHGRLHDGIIGSAKIIKCKNYIDGKNPEGREYFYKLQNGYFYQQEIPYLLSQGKRYFTEKERTSLIKDIETYCSNDQNSHYDDVNYNY
ncbi:MAG: bifunctional DNA primase/polymerase [Desulfovibrionaceae bacterium]|nr:bifunctional DNA primase/polymerase [Desulfovibrionaceae bacterium]